MINGIKSMILEKENYMEAAQLIFEDAAHGGIDDLIVLNEKADVPEDDEDNKDPDIDDENHGNDDKNVDDEDDDITNIPIDDENDIKDGDNPDNIVDPKPEEDDILGMPVDGDEIEPVLEPTDDLPVVGNGSDDLLNISIDLRSNTIADVLPVPPDNAGEAIADDILATRVDSGFQEDAQPAPEPASSTPPAPVQTTDPAGTAAGFPMDEGVDDILNESWDPNKFDKSQLGNVNRELAELKKIGNSRLFTKEELDKFKDVVANHKSNLPGDFKRSIDAIMEKQKEFKKAGKKIEESVDSFLEAITLDGGGSEDKPADGTDATAAPAESTPEDPGDPPVEEPVEGGEENEVTAAVKDKVAEADAPIEGGDSTSTSKEALLKKLGSISKGLEDAKKAIIDTIK